MLGYKGGLGVNGRGRNELLCVCEDTYTHTLSNRDLNAKCVLSLLNSDSDPRSQIYAGALISLHTHLVLCVLEPDRLEMGT